MPLGSERAQSSLQSPSPTRRILTKITSPFAKKSKNVPEFFVQAEDPHKQYSAGDNVRGSVIVKVVKPIRVTHIVVRLHGFVQVYKTPNAPPAEGFRTYNNLAGRGRGKRKGEYFGNGFATLFEDEHVVCGDGRLAEGSYKFEFEMAFPPEIMPSSIDFERGTITYMITATMTRPTSMAPLIFHDQKIAYVEKIDIAGLLPPKPRTITLEALSRRPRGRNRTKKKVVSADSSKTGEEILTSTSSRQHMPPSIPSTPGGDGLPMSPSPSTRSLESQPSSNCTTSVSGSFLPRSSAADSVSLVNGQSSGKGRTIAVTVESLRGGCLRGDNIPVKIGVQHVKHLKSMYGVIVTLYRQARVDTHPVLPPSPAAGRDKQKHEEYYPKSLTGLGGLSLSGAGSSHVFRKDMAQFIMPLMIDPQSLEAEVHAKVRMPEDAFPTISTVPGSMITFKYYIEVIVDVQGKLAGQDRFFAQANNAGSPSGLNGSSQDVGDILGSDRGQHLQGQSIIDTAPIRRDKSVVMCLLEVVVGTRDTDRTKGKGKAKEVTDIRDGLDGQTDVNGTTVRHRPLHNLPEVLGGNQYPHLEHYDNGVSHQDGQDLYGYDAQCSGEFEYYDQYDYPPQEDYWPPNHHVVNENLSEKEQLRRAEAALMPSQPPGMIADLSDDAGPSAPVLEDEQIRGGREDEPDALSTGIQVPGPSHSSSTSTRHMDVAEIGCTGSAPDYDEERTDGGSRGQHTAVDDKQELLQRQLQSEASEPPQDGGAELGVHEQAGPSAPSFHVLQEDMDMIDDVCEIRPAYTLPHYER